MTSSPIKRTIFCAALLAVSTVARPDPLPVFEPLAYLVDHCWRGTFPDGKATDEHCFEWVYGGKHLRDTHVVRGAGAPYLGETIYTWDATSSRLIFRYWNSLGGYSDGYVEFRDGEMYVPGERYTGPDGVELEIRSVWRPIGADRYEARSETLRDGVWTEVWRIAFRRVD